MHKTHIDNGVIDNKKVSSVQNVNFANSLDWIDIKKNIIIKMYLYQKEIINLANHIKMIKI